MTLDISLLSGEFDVREAVVPVSTAVPVIVAQQDPTRWALIFSVGGTGGTVFLSTTSNPDASHGITLGLQTNLILYFNQAGGLTQSAWYGRWSASTASLTVIEVRLRPRR